MRSADEAWHFYEGDPLELLTADAEFGQLERHALGPAGEGRLPVHVVPAGVWQAARTTGEYTLVGCTVGPAFEFDDFEILSDAERAVERARVRQPATVTFI